MPVTDLYNARAEQGCAHDALQSTPPTAGIPMEVAFFVPEATQEVGTGSSGMTATSSPLSMLRVLLLQIGLGMVVAMLFWGMNGTVSGYSAALGALTCVLPNAFLAMRLALPRNKSASRPLMRAAFTGELGKLALTIVMFSMIFMLVKPLAAGALFAGFIAGQLATIAALLMTRRDARTTDSKSNLNGE